MNKTACLLILLVFSAAVISCRKGVPTIITGQLRNIPDTSLTIDLGKDPITGLEPAGYPKEIVINQDGTFNIHIEAPFPVSAVLYTENGGFVANVRLVHPGEIHLTADCEDLENTLSYHGSGSSLNEFYYDIGKFRRDVRREFTSGKASLADYASHLDSMNAISLQRLEKFHDYEDFTDKELLWLTSEFRYGKYQSLNRRAHQQDIALSDSAYRFFEALDLKDQDAVLISRTYVNAILQYMLYLVNAKGIYHSQFDDNSTYYRYYYETILNTLQGKVRDVILTNHILDMLNDNVVFSKEYYEKYLSDCQSPGMLEKTSRLYEEYVVVAQKSMDERVVFIPTHHLSPRDVLNQFKGKIVFLDFWASWCSPCIESIPQTREMLARYKDQPLAFIYVGNNDQESSLIHAIKKYELLGTHMILDKRDSETWRSTFQIHGIPSYVLLDKEGKRIRLDNSHRISDDTYTLIDSLLAAHL